MFTGIIQSVGRVNAVEHRGDASRLVINTGGLGCGSLAIGDSIAVNGVCLTAVQTEDNSVAADVSRETLDCTTLADLQVASPVNLELAMLPSTRLGGHLVSGHVDGVGKVLERRPSGESVVMRIAVPDALARYIAAKGSICVDGVSLTVNRCREATFEVNIIPHTLEQTILGGYAVGTQVNIEVDVIARYLERLITGRSDGGGDVSYTLLAEYGFAK